MPPLARTPLVAALALVAAVLCALELSGRAIAPWQVAGSSLVAAAAVATLPRRPAWGVAILPLGFLASEIGRWEGDSPGVLVVVMLLTVYRIGEAADRRTGLLALAWITLAGQTFTVATGGWYPGDVLFAVTVYALPWLFGRTVRSGRDAQAELERRTAELEDERRRRAALEVARERARLATEVNGVVNDALRSMVGDAGRGLHALPDDRAAAGARLEAIETAGRDALREMRALLGVLREAPRPDGPARGEDTPPARPLTPA